MSRRTRLLRAGDARRGRRSRRASTAAAASARVRGRVVFVPRAHPGDRVRARVSEVHAGWAEGALVEVLRAVARPARFALPLRAALRRLRLPGLRRRTPSCGSRSRCCASRWRARARRGRGPIAVHASPESGLAHAGVAPLRARATVGTAAGAAARRAPAAWWTSRPACSSREAMNRAARALHAALAARPALGRARPRPRAPRVAGRTDARRHARDGARPPRGAGARLPAARPCPGSPASACARRRPLARVALGLAVPGRERARLEPARARVVLLPGQPLPARAAGANRGRARAAGRLAGPRPLRGRRPVRAAARRARRLRDARRRAVGGRGRGRARRRRAGRAWRGCVCAGGRRSAASASCRRARASGSCSIRRGPAPDAAWSRRSRRARPAVVVYVSCDPPTLGRDLALFAARGYRPDAVHLFDQFPKTFHVETVVRLRCDGSRKPSEPTGGAAGLHRLACRPCVDRCWAWPRCFGAGCLLSDGRGSAPEALVARRLRRSGALARGPGRPGSAGSCGARRCRARPGSRGGCRGTARDRVGRPLRRAAGAGGARGGRLRGRRHAARGRGASATAGWCSCWTPRRVRERRRSEPAGGRVRVEVGGEAAKPRLLDGDRVAAWMTLRPAGDAARRPRGLRLLQVGASRRAAARRGGTRCAGTSRASRERARGAFDALDAGRNRARARAGPWCWATARRSTTPRPRRSRPPGPTTCSRSRARRSRCWRRCSRSGLRRLRAGPWTEAGVTALAIFAYAGFVGGDVPIVARRDHGGGRAARAGPRGRRGRLEPAGARGARAARAASRRAPRTSASSSPSARRWGSSRSSPRSRAGVPRLPLRLDLALAASVAAQCALAPLLALHFHRLAPAAILLNVAAVPLSARRAARRLRGPGARARSARGGLAGGLAWLAARALRLSGDLGPVRRLARRPRSGASARRARAPRRGPRAAAARPQAARASWPSPPAMSPSCSGRSRHRPTAGLHLTVVDVGQGDGLLLRSPSGRAIVVDAGGSRDGRFDPGERRMAPAAVAAGRAPPRCGRRSRTPTPTTSAGVPFLLRAFRVDSAWEGPAALAGPLLAAIGTSPGRVRRPRASRSAGEPASSGTVRDSASSGPAPPAGPLPRCATRTRS